MARALSERGAVRAGKLDKRVTLQSASIAQDAAGEEIETWADLATVWGRIIPDGRSERGEADGNVARETGAIEVRYRPDLTATAKMRVIHGDRVYHIEGPPRDIDSRGTAWELSYIHDPEEAA